ncbi:unnamed protein product [Adineta steineri]|nr:unnamed protein product [Adineta steineri]CAF1393614.1 unnamed protein product [Adineta steineri]
MGLYLTFLQSDIVTINRLIKTDKFDSYLVYVLFVFIGLGFVSLMLAFFSIYGVIKRNRSLSLFVTALWAFSFILNLIMLAISILYYYFVFSQLRSLLVHSFQQSPAATASLLDSFQLKYKCCGIDNKDDYNSISSDSFPSSCCQEPNCLHTKDVNNNSTSLMNSKSLLHTNGCYPIVKKYLTIELLLLMGVTGLCALLHFLAIILLCILNQRYKKFDDIPKIMIHHLASGVPINSNNYVQNVSKTIHEPVEITQI